MDWFGRKAKREHEANMKEMDLQFQANENERNRKPMSLVVVGEMIKYFQEIWSIKKNGSFWKKT